MHSVWFFIPTFINKQQLKCDFKFFINFVFVLSLSLPSVLAQSEGGPQHDPYQISLQSITPIPNNPDHFTVKWKLGDFGLPFVAVINRSYTMKLGDWERISVIPEQTRFFEMPMDIQEIDAAFFEIRNAAGFIATGQVFEGKVNMELSDVIEIHLSRLRGLSMEESYVLIYDQDGNETFYLKDLDVQILNNSVRVLINPGERFAVPGNECGLVTILVSDLVNGGGNSYEGSFVYEVSTDELGVVD